MNPFRPPANAERTPIRAELPSVKTTGKTATLRLYDPIDSWGGGWGVSAKEFTRVLDELPDDTTEIRLLINSPGGEVFEGIAIMNALRSHPAKITAIVEGIAASSASFIAAAADELVMMQNSQLFIHNAWSIALGDAAELRDVADELEATFDRNIASVYAAKSGDTVEHWLAEMDKDRFLTADEAVAEKLADRIEGVGDAEAAKAKFDLSVFARKDGRRAAARAGAQHPSSSEPGEPNRKEDVMAYDDLKAGLAKRLGVSETDASDEMLLAALDESLSEQADTPAEEAAPVVAALPEGTVAIDATVLEELRDNAKRGAEARAEQDKVRRDGIVAEALRTGRITAASKDDWRARLDKDEAGFAEVLASLPENTVPVVEIGHATASAEADDAYPAHWKR